MSSSSVAFQQILIGCATGLSLGLLYLVLLAPIKDRESFYQWLMGGMYQKKNQSEKDKSGTWSDDNAVVAQADGNRTILNHRSNEDAIAMAESSFLTVPQHPLDTRYTLPEPVELPRSLAKYLRT